MTIITQPQNLPFIEALWRVRLRHAWKSLRSNFGLFAENRIGLVGLGIIIFYALLAAAHPILMATVWDAKVYDHFVGNDTTIFEHPSAPTAKHILGTDPMGRDVLSQLMFSTRTHADVFSASASARGSR